MSGNLGLDQGGGAALPVVLDLFGDPVPLNRGRKGRPAHVVTTENRGLVTMLVALGNKHDAIAAVLRISEPTLRKYYFAELGDPAIERMRVKGKLLVGAMVEANKGNVGAIKFVQAEMEKAALGALATKVADRPAPPPKRGKKEQAKVDAAAVIGKFAPPPPPSKLFN